METKVTKKEEGFFALDKRGKIILESVIEQINTMVISDVDVVIPDGSIINNDAHHAEPYATGVDIAKGTLNLSGNIAINNASGVAGLYTNDKVVKVTGSLTVFRPFSSLWGGWAAIKGHKP